MAARVGGLMMPKSAATLFSARPVHVAKLGGEGEPPAPWRVVRVIKEDRLTACRLATVAGAGKAAWNARLIRGSREDIPAVMSRIDVPVTILSGDRRRCPAARAPASGDCRPPARCAQDHCAGCGSFAAVGGAGCGRRRNHASLGGQRRRKTGIGCGSCVSMVRTLNVSGVGRSYLRLWTGTTGSSPSGFACDYAP